MANLSLAAAALTLGACSLAAPSQPFHPPVPGPSASEAPSAFDNKSNGVVDDSTHEADQTTFDEVEEIDDGLGPLYNAQSCRDCHQNPTSGGPNPSSISSTSSNVV